jgi:hypothetical protein
VFEGEILKQMNNATDSMKKTEDDTVSPDATPSTDSTENADATESEDAAKEGFGKEQFVTQKDIKKLVDGINSFMSKTK